MIDPKNVCLFQPSELQDFKARLFGRIGDKIKAKGGTVCAGDYKFLNTLPKEVIPIVGCSPYLKPIVQEWRRTKRPFIYWDRGYARRIFATALPPGSDGGYYRWHCNAFQMQSTKSVPDDRWKALAYDNVVRPWRKNGKHIVIAAPSKTYEAYHGIESWIADTILTLAKITGRQMIIRQKEQCNTRPLQLDLEGAHCLVTHGSIAAVESVILGCPVFVHPDSAAALMGKTDLMQIEQPIYPERQPWLNALAYCQYTENELVDGTLWKLLT